MVRFVIAGVSALLSSLAYAGGEIECNVSKYNKFIEAKQTLIEGNRAVLRKIAPELADVIDVSSAEHSSREERLRLAVTVLLRDGDSAVLTSKPIGDWLVLSDSLVRYLKGRSEHFRLQNKETERLMSEFASYDDESLKDVYQSRVYGDLMEDVISRFSLSMVAVEAINCEDKKA